MYLCVPLLLLHFHMIPFFLGKLLFMGELVRHMVWECFGLPPHGGGVPLSIKRIPFAIPTGRKEATGRDVGQAQARDTLLLGHQSSTPNSAIHTHRFDQHRITSLLNFSLSTICRPPSLDAADPRGPRFDAPLSVSRGAFRIPLGPGGVQDRLSTCVEGEWAS